jgi:hypothetical protein
MKYDTSLYAVLDDLYDYGTKPYLKKGLLDSKMHK